MCLTVLVACKQKQEEAKTPPPPPEIPVIVAEPQEVQIHIEFVGQIYGHKDIAIRARVEGFVEELHFEEGSEVKKADLLYTLESQPFEADVAAKMSRVAEAKTMLAKATSDLGRIKPLAERKAVSESDLDAAVAQYEASQASVEAAEANLRASKIQLSYTKVLSPIDGVIGKTQAKVGDFVGRSPNPVILNVVSNIDSILVEFFLTETQYLQIARRYLTEEHDIIKAAEKRSLELILTDGSVYPHKGQFDFIDRGLDPSTGAILVQVSFPNPDKLLRPGQFAKIRAIAENLPDGILVPQRCVSELQGRHRIYVVGDGNKVEEREIKTGATVGSYWLIEEGLKPGEIVVFEGLQKVGNGVVVKPVVTTPELPTPKEQ